MKTALIARLHGDFEQAPHNGDGIEYGFARELQSLLGYSTWRRFEEVIDRAKTACTNAGQAVADHFADAGKMVSIGSGSYREINDVALTHYDCYLIAQNGTNTQIKERDLHGEADISREHVRNHQDVRKILTDRNIRPEALPPAEDVEMVGRRPKSDEKRLPSSIAPKKRPKR